MHTDPSNRYRKLLENDPPSFFDRVNTPWDHVPDLEDYNRHAYTRIVRALRELSRSQPGDAGSNTQGILVLGEAGTGKTHLLMRVARNLSESNHILFIRKPNNEDAVAQHIWANVVQSLTRSLPTSGSEKSQLDDLLAHVFSKVLIPEFEQDIREGKDADEKQRWASRLREDPYNLFNMLGEGERRQGNMEKIRRRTLRFLQLNHPEIDQTIAHVLITYCFVLREDRKRVLLNWLSGQDVDEAEAKDLGLPTSWVTVEEDSSDTSTQQQREEHALRAVRTIGVLSTHYQPLILAFDQLEGLRDKERLTANWGDRVREIFTMAPNFLVVTCIFPSLWETWFKHKLDQSISERIAQQTVTLENFQPQHGLQMLATHLEPSFTKHRLPTNIFPFTESDVADICKSATSPRSFLQAARSTFQSWLDGDASVVLSPEKGTPQLVTQQDIDALLRSSLAAAEKAQRQSFETEMVVEQDFFGRLRNLTETALAASGCTVELSKATCAHYVMPPNVVVRNDRTGETVCLAVMNSEGGSFAARMRNLNRCAQEADQFSSLVILRDRRCRRLGPRSQDHLQAAQDRGAAFIHAGVDEVTCLNAAYETLTAVEEHDLCIGKHEIDKRQLVGFLKSERYLGRTEFYRHAARMSPSIATAIGVDGNQASNPVTPPPKTSIPQREEPVPPRSKPSEHSRPPGHHRSRRVDVVIGDDTLESPHIGVLGELRDGKRRLAISLTKPQCLVLLGYMGSGKSYALGVLIENALLTQPGLIEQSRPMSVVAFNYRKNPQSRFEYGGFAIPNSNTEEVEKLLAQYGAAPMAVEAVNVFGYELELQRRTQEHAGLRTFPIRFRPDELSAEHWEILMKPPSRESEYMDIIRDIIQKLFYQERLTFKNLEKHILTDERLSNQQRRKATNRLSFAERWISDNRPYEWGDILQEGTLNIFDLRIQTMEASEALKLCLIITDLVRRTKNGVNKLIVFDEAHEYVDSKELVGELENSITQIRHDGLSFVLASQFPERIPERVFKYLLTRLIFKLPTAKAISYVRSAAPNLDSLSPQKVANLDLEAGLCYVQTDDDCTDRLLKVPQALEIRPRCTMHGGATVRQLGEVDGGASTGETEADDSEPDTCPECGSAVTIRKRPSGAFIACTDFPRCSYTKQMS